MPLRRLLRSVLAAAATLAVVVPSVAAVPVAHRSAVASGKYAGRTGEGKPFRFRVSHGRVKKLSFRWSAYCSDDAGYLSGTYRPRGFSAKISKRRRFKSHKTVNGVELRISGRFRGRKASGKAHFRLEDCDAGTVKWKAKLKS
jgi:hypothetical protein